MLKRNFSANRKALQIFRIFQFRKNILKLLFSGRKVQNINTTCVNMTSLVLSQEILSWFDRVLRCPYHTYDHFYTYRTKNFMGRPSKFSENINSAFLNCGWFSKMLHINITCRYIITCNFFIVTICFELS